jgi:ribonuclease PH
MMRVDKRRSEQLREIKVELDYLEYPAGSCLISFGKTKVLCAVSVEKRVPPFLLGQGRGWLTAEYSMLPASTKERTQREARTGRLSGRTQEIRRLIGRSLRPIFDLSVVGERTFIIDCDVIQADGGTRTAAVNGAFLALYSAVEKMNVNKEFSAFPIIDFVAAISIGIVNKEMLLDLCYEEDCAADIDMNLVMTGRGKLVEVQATAEHVPVDRSGFNKMIDIGARGIEQIISLEKKLLGKSNP